MSRKDLHKLDRIGSWMERLDLIAEEMEKTGDEFQILAEHVDSITGDLEFQRQALLKNGPIVTKRGRHDIFTSQGGRGNHGQR